MADAAHYDELWQSTWGDIQRSGPVHRHVQEDVVRVVARLGVRGVLDVGCGSGENLAALEAAGNYELAGSDVSERALELARRRLPNVPLEFLDVERAALPAQFDLVMSIQVVEHLEDDIAALRNIAAMSKRYVFTSTVAGRMRASEVAIGHVRNYSPVELRRKHELAGLEVMWIRGWGFPFYSPLYRTAVELLPGGPPTGTIGRFAGLAARALYHLYRLNVPGRGDVISLLARRRDPAA